MVKKSVGSLFGHQQSVLTYEPGETFTTRDMVGIEVELEGIRRLPSTGEWAGGLQYWKIKNDESLRQGGKEFVLRQPLFGRDLEMALKEFDKFMSACDEIGANNINVSERCSIHCHLDVRDLEKGQLSNLFLLYLSIEKLLFKVSGGRVNNIYCIPLSDTIQVKQCFNMLAKENPSDRDVVGAVRMDKYGAMNTGVVESLGSVEFRHHKGTRDVNEIGFWVQVLLGLKDYCKRFETPINDLPKYISVTGLMEFIRKVFGENHRKFIYDDFHLDLLDGVRYAQETINYHKMVEVSNSISKSSGVGGGSKLKERYMKKHNIKEGGEDTCVV